MGQGAWGRGHPQAERVPIAIDLPSERQSREVWSCGALSRGPSCTARHLSRGGSGAEHRATREPWRATVSNGLLRSRGPIAVPCVVWAQLSRSHRWPRTFWGGGRGGPVQCVRLSLLFQVLCLQHLHLSPAHHPLRMLAKLEEGCLSPSDHPTPSTGAPGAQEAELLGLAR